MSEVQGRIDVATSERDMLLRKSEGAKVLGLYVPCSSGWGHIDCATHAL